MQSNNAGSNVNPNPNAIIAPAVHVPTMQSSGMLVELSISYWSGIKKDRDAGEELTANKGAARGVANVSKRLLGDCAELDAVRKFVANARNTHYAMTLPWSDLGLRYCTTPQYIGAGHRDGYNRTMTGLQAEFGRLVEAFLDAYDWEKQNAQLKLGELFNADEYPTRDKLQSKFSWRCTAMPLPDAGDFRIDVTNEALREAKVQYEKYYNDKIAEAMGDLWKRVHKVVANMAERLDYKEGESKKKFHDTLVSNVQDMLDMLATCNISNDPTMESARKKLDRALMGVTPDALREDAHLRAETQRSAAEIKKIIENLPGLGF